MMLQLLLLQPQQQYTLPVLTLAMLLDRILILRASCFMSPSFLMTCLIHI